MDIILQDLDPRETFLKWFTENPQIRPNRRGLFEIPTLSFKTGIILSAEGSVLFNYGDTIIAAAVKFEVAEPEMSKSEEPFLVVNFHYSAGARSDVKPGPPSDEVQEITESLSKIIKSHVIDFESLGLIPGILSMVIFVDVVCICDTGFAFEAALLASIFALQNTSLPSISLNEETGMVFINSEEIPQKLILKSLPCSFYFAVLNKDIILLAPDHQERMACNGFGVKIVLDLISGSLIDVEKGQVCIHDDILLSKIVPIAKSSAEKLKILLEIEI